MRQAQKSNRARGRGGRKGGGGGGNNLNRVYESAGPEGKVRGTPQQIVEKYLSLARDAQTSGDRVVAENFLQHAEHYQRIVLQAMGAQEERRESVASDQDDDDADDTPQASQGHRGGEHRPQGGNPQHSNGRDHGSQPSSDGSPSHSAPNVVSSMATIDLSDDDQQDLLVTTDQPSGQPHVGEASDAADPAASEAKAPQARRPRRPRRRPAETEASGAEAPASGDEN
ncbi:DUF4167 domain-containing protein [Limibaculum sp. M0105]|uniref:DUF4167 domain-containing protein n=1 Tax=Thermohalobaculum xanthum TaxID=2753746 RepID=A0A8J7M4Y5_9RHOB|nr:DUF4167 domain-containing protein [Thermohalobaculum xanthum]MBK0398406.1 DUF4167 domain-containing protein [Thermohalobaculum xanthum]